MGAYGAALIALRAEIRQTGFRGYAVCRRPIVTQSFGCKDCPNLCEVIEIIDDGKLISRSGGRCRKWEATPHAGAACRQLYTLDAR
jgi:hypothetical protein